MKETLREFLKERDVFDVDICKDLGNNQIGIKRYLDLAIKMFNDEVDIQGIGQFSLSDHLFEISSVGFLTIKARNRVNEDHIMVM